MAVFMISRSASTQVRVQQWIMQHFGYYTNLALSCTSFAASESFGSRSGASRFESDDFQRDCDMVYRRFEVPIKLIRGSKQWLDKWSVTTAAARIFLQGRLGRGKKTQAQQQSFPFMRLPAELRNRIYELVLRFPESGVCVKLKADDRDGSFRIPARLSVMREEAKSFNEVHMSDLDAAYFDHSWSAIADDLPDGVLFCRPPAVCLALLQVSKEVFQEAMPVFYSTNNFIFAKVKQLQCSSRPLLLLGANTSSTSPSTTDPMMTSSRARHSSCSKTSRTSESSTSQSTRPTGRMLRRPNRCSESILTF